MAVKDETGNRYGMLKVLSRVENDAFGSAMWLCQCDCGEQTLAVGSNLRRGQSKSCGCQKPDSKTKDETGNRYGRLTVKSKEGVNARRYMMWLCVCDCGETIVLESTRLRTGNTKSCGCLFKESHRTHEKSNTPEYSVWRGLKQRCQNPKAPEYHNYGGRGITVSDDWSTFEQFFEDMGARPSETHSLDRIDNSMGYSKENCRWATKVQQARNRRSSKLVTYKGETLTVVEWSERLGINTCTLRDRLREGWTVERAFEEPVNVKG